MPKKTKRAKKRADARRNLIPPTTSAPQKSPLPQEATPAAAAPALYTIRSSGTVQKTPVRSEDDDREFRSIKKDLARTVILASLAFLAELVLFWKFGSE